MHSEGATGVLTRVERHFDVIFFNCVCLVPTLRRATKGLIKLLFCLSILESIKGYLGLFTNTQPLHNYVSVKMYLEAIDLFILRCYQNNCVKLKHKGKIDTLLNS